MLNFDTIQQMVTYAEKQGKVYGKTFRFNITTNGTQLNEHIRSFLAAHKFGVIVSLDGERDVHDSMRPFANGQGSYDKIRSYLDAHQKERQTNETQWTLRATFTRHNLNFADQVFHLASLGFHDISVEPCASKDPDLGISQNDLPTLKAEYSSFTKRYLKALREGQEFSFFHLNVMLEQAKQGSQRLTQCGAGRGYLAVSAGGQLYPCHRLVGQEQYELGNVYEGIKYPERRQLFASAYVNSKSACRQCWARYICGGGCHAHAIQFNGDISVPYELECELMKQRIELGAYLWSVLSHDQQDNLNLLYDQALTNRPHLSES